MTDNEYMEKATKAYLITILSGSGLLGLVGYIFYGYAILLITGIIVTIWLVVRIYMIYIYQLGKRYIDEYEKPLDKDK